MRICFTFSREVLIFVVGSFLFRNSRISICVLEDRSASLNFCVESHFPSKIVLVSVLKYHLHALHSCYRYLSLKSEKNDGSLTTKYATVEN